MSQRYYIMLFSQSSTGSRPVAVSRWLLHLTLVVGTLAVGAFSYFVCDYIAMRQLKIKYHIALNEKKHMQSEARHVASHLEMAKEKLKKLDDHMVMLRKLAEVKVDKLSQNAGIGPLDEEEAMIQEENEKSVRVAENSSALGLSYDDFVFRPLMEKIGEVDQIAHDQSQAMKLLLLNLQRKKHLIFSVPVGKPTSGWISSSYGPRISPFTGTKAMHYGIDIAARVGSPVYAPADGVVIFAGNKAGFGRFLMVAHDHGIVTKYGHNAELFVKMGERVKRGDPIAAVGSSGRSTGPHLHYEIWVNGKPQDPKRFLLLSDMSWNL